MTAAGPGTVELRSVTKRYGAHAAVDRVSLLVEDGTLVTLLGPSGCGKTTTLRIIAGLETPSEGQVLIGGRDVSDLPPADRNVSLVFQSYALFPHLSVLDNVAYGPRVQGARAAEAQGRAREALALLGLEGFEARLPSQLSGGQQQRVAVARALVLKPAVLLFDEPLSNLDARLRRRVRDEIRGLQRRLGVSVVYVTHDREEALAVSDRIIVMDQGRVAESGPPGELFAAPRTAFVADFLAEATLAAARLTGVAGELGEVNVAGHVVRVAHRGHRPGPVTVAIRPDAVQVDDGGPGITGRILRAAFVGRAIEYTIDTAAGDLFAICPATASLRAPGAPVTVQLAPAGVTIVDAAPRNASA